MTALSLKKSNNGDGRTKTPSKAGVAKVSNTKTASVTSLPPKHNVKTYKRIFVDYMHIYFRVKLSAYIEYASIVKDSLYKVGCVEEFLTFFAKSYLRDVVQRRSQAGTIHSFQNCSHIT